MDDAPGDRATEGGRLNEQLDQARAERDFYRHIAESTGRRNLGDDYNLSRIIKHLRQTEDALRRTQEELEYRVIERTADLHRANLHLQQEIAERRLVQETLLKSQRSLQAVVDSVDAILYVADMNTYDILLINGYARKLFGDVPGMKCWQTLHEGQTGPCSFCTNSRLIGADGSLLDTYIWEFRNTANGRWYECRDKAIRWIDGRIVRLAVAGDITERKKAEQAFARMEKLEAIGTLAAGIAHDFNNLLGGMFGYLELSQQEAQKAHQQEIADYLSLALGAFERARNLTHQLLTFAKGGAPIRKTQSLSVHVRKTISFSLSGSNVFPVFAIPGDIALCDFDENQISQVLDNIAINARQAMPRGGTLDVSMNNVDGSEVSESLRGSKYVRVSIRDYGIGIAPEHLPHIFDPFFTTKTAGSGLGLATSHSIIRQHDGFIDVKSVPDQGATFHIYLPASAEPLSAATDATQQAHQGKGRILIMDDEEIILDVVSLLLKVMGYDVALARNGKDALEAVKDALQAGQPFVGAILDLTIPGGLGGKDIVHDLLALDPAIRVIASSGYSNDPVMSNPSEYGFAACLIKPYRKSDLSLVLESSFPDPL